MVHSTVVITSYKYQDTELSLEIVEEEETNHKENSPETDEKIQEYILLKCSDFSSDMENFYTYSKKLNYYKLHIIDYDEKRPLDNPPEA